LNPESDWFTYGSAVEPGSQWTPNPDCPEHFPIPEGLDGEALALFRAGCSRPVTWDEFTDRQKKHWRAVAHKAREIHGRSANIARAARVLHANTHDSPANSSDWEDMAWPERSKWCDRAEMVIKAGIPPKAGSETNCNRHPNNGAELQHASPACQHPDITFHAVTTPKTSRTE